jgi:hypothetical protein
MHRPSKRSRREQRRLEMPTLRLTACERRRHHLRQPHDLRGPQVRGRYRDVPRASMGPRPLEIDARQDRRQSLHAVLDDV